MEISELKTFLMVAKCTSFSLAAEKLFLTQPAVSKRISSLESSLNTKLFDRIGHKVSLTQSGKILAPKAEAILLEINDLQKSISNLSTEIKGSLILGASHHIGLRRLPPVLQSYSKSHPLVDLDIRFLDSEQATESVIRGDIELAIVTLPKNQHPNIQREKIWNDPLHIVVAEDHPLTLSKKISLEDLGKFKAILPSERTFTRRIIEEKFRTANIPIETAMNTNYIETIRMMVSIGMGWSALPKTMIDDSLSILPIAALSIKRDLGCIYHRDRTLSNPAKALLELLKSNKN